MLKQEKKKYFHLLYSQLEDSNPNDPKKLWKTIDEIKNINETQENPISFEEWEQRFNDLLHVDYNTNEPNTDLHINQEYVNEELNFPITCKEVKNALKNLKNGKSAGLDLVCN